MRFSRDFRRDFDAVVQAEEAFGFVRFGDGEHAIMDGLPFRAASGWSFEGGAHWLAKPLLSALTARVDGFYLGLPSPCCIPAAAQYCRQYVKAPLFRQTFAALFSKANYPRFPKLRLKFEHAAVVSSGQSDFRVPNNATRDSWDIDALVQKLLDVDRPILVAAGPSAKVIIHRYWTKQDPEKRQTIIDVGSSIDREIHGKVTRYYNKDKGRHHACDWSTWAPFAPRKSKSSQARAFANANTHGFKPMSLKAKKAKQAKKPTGMRRVNLTQGHRPVASLSFKAKRRASGKKVI